MTAIFAFFAFGTIGFWILLSLIGITSLVAVAKESNGFLGVALVIGGILLWPSILAVISIKHLIMLAIGYVVCGSLWSIFKWWRFVQIKVEQARNGEKIVKHDLMIRFNKGRVMCWLAGWPASVFWTFTHELFETVYELLAGIYRKIGERGIAELEKIESDQKEEKIKAENW